LCAHGDVGTSRSLGDERVGQNRAERRSLERGRRTLAESQAVAEGAKQLGQAGWFPRASRLSTSRAVQLFGTTRRQSRACRIRLRRIALRVGREHAIRALRLLPDLPNLRREGTLATLRRVLSAGFERFGFRLIEFSIQTNYLHLIAEAEDARSFAHGMQGLLVRVAKALNKDWGRHGKVLADRYHARILSTPREVRNALVYVLQNARKHGARLTGIDAFSSGPWFDGWRDRVARAARPIAAAGSWLLTSGWRRWGLLSASESPASAVPVGDLRARPRPA